MAETYTLEELLRALAFSSFLAGLFGGTAVGLYCGFWIGNIMWIALIATVFMILTTINAVVSLKAFSLSAEMIAERKWKIQK